MLVFMNCAPVWPVLSEDIYEGCVRVCVCVRGGTLLQVYCVHGESACV